MFLHAAELKLRFHTRLFDQRCPLPRDPTGSQAARPNVLMFGDGSFNRERIDEHDGITKIVGYAAFSGDMGSEDPHDGAPRLRLPESGLMGEGATEATACCRWLR